MIKVRFPASWFVFCTEIPLFLSDFAEATVTPLPVLVTVTPLTPISGRRHAGTFYYKSGKPTAALWFSDEMWWNDNGRSKSPHQEESVYRRSMPSTNLLSVWPKLKHTIELVLGEAKLTVSPSFPTQTWVYCFAWTILFILRSFLYNPTYMNLFPVTAPSQHCGMKAGVNKRK